jgi:hypothetical protein
VERSIHIKINRRRKMNEGNIFSGGAPVQTPQGAVAVQATKAISEVQGQIIMARKFPRDPVASYDRVLTECARLTLAERAVYTYPRGGTTVTGPSIRLAEAIARAWGNLSFGLTEVERDDGVSSVIAWAWDLETNVRRETEFKQAHVRDTRQGRKPLTDERDIYEIVANNGARRMRACILSLIPGDVVDSAVEACNKTLKVNIGNVKEATKKMVEAFAAIGVTQEKIEKRLGHRLDTIEAGEIVSLRSIYTAITDRMGKAEDYFPEEKKAEDVVKTAEPKQGNEDLFQKDGKK